jgi:hypothetical protein
VSFGRDDADKVVFGLFQWFGASVGISGEVFPPQNRGRKTAEKAEIGES